MKSIRVSLIVYFLLLMAVALGAIGTLVYRTTLRTLREKEETVRNLLEERYESHRREVMEQYDKRILRQARTLAQLAEQQIGAGTDVFHEYLEPLGGVALGVNPRSHFLLPLWSGLPRNPLAQRIRRSYIQIRFADALIAHASDEGEENASATEYFQVYNEYGLPLQRSHTLPADAFTLDPELLQKLDLYWYQFDDTEIKPGVRVRRVTCRVPVSQVRIVWTQRQPREQRRGNRSGPPRVQPPPFPAPRPAGQMVRRHPIIFIQCAADTSRRDAHLAGFDDGLRSDLADLEDQSRLKLADLRDRLLGTSLLVFAATVIGGCWLVGLGLFPLNRLAEAVSKVSAKDFRLPLDDAPLARELKPIVERLKQTLDALQKAFTREKQAAADISHELRTPLAALLATTDMALRKPRTPEEYRAILEDCRASGRQMSQLVERLLTLARLDAGVAALREREIDAAELAQTCAEVVQPLAKARGLELTLHNGQPVPLRTDPDKLREVLSNLLHNAIEYNKPGGSIDVHVGRKNGALLLEVADTGIGIAPQVRERIFERFYRADPSRQADGLHAGLGLAISKSYVELLGGTIAVDSVVGEGSRFSVELPIR